jgi:HSP20 family molecular chaperone IbpA
VYQVPNVPPVNVFINKDTKEMIFEFALAGYKKENISINFSGDYMELKLRESEEKANQQLEIVRRGIKNCNINFKYYF